MDPIDGLGALALVPASTAIVLAFLTRNTLFALTVACLAGVLVAGLGPAGFPKLLVTALGNEGFAWVMLLEFFIGMLIAFFQRTGAIENFSAFISRQAMTRRRVQLMTWLMGTFVYFSDYFSPLFVGSTMRKLSDEYRVSREKLAYICDSTSAPVSILVPITGWAVFVAGLTIGMGPIGTADEALAVFVASVPYNLYAWMAVLLVALIALGIFPDWGPMAKAERRAQDSGQVLRLGSQPMLAEELTGLEPFEGVKTSLFWNFFFPVLLVIGFALTAVALVGSAKPMEAFLLAVVVSAVIMRFQGFPLEEITRTAVTGVKGIMPAVIILALAYALNALSEAMQTAEVILAMTEGWLSPALLPALAFLLTGAVAFSTGTSWGTYAIMIPLALPLALGFSGDALGPLVYATLAAVAGGGVFGDHCSPLSDTSILASTGAASDHMDHVKTQLPYALAVASLSLGAYLLLGLTL